ncbi:ligand-binding sensor domain-containing diguanylate cyclase [Alishewanella sp. d11]|uniref:ligand-binding sensor domain-containing diguanylate cyclase n=1 Tax=Alishewanella sp. d11 TaxID=3414030 RepID=UPI003BF88B15
MQRCWLWFVTFCCHLPLLLPLALATSPSIYDYDIKHWTSADGLSSNSVRAITQDKQGYMWFGTLFGLNRFDGSQFEVFNTELYPKLASNAITQLLTDSAGNIWIGTKAGLSVLDANTLVIERLPIFSEVTSLLEVQPGEIWVAADQLFSISAGKVQRVEPIKAVVSQITQADGQIWVASREGLYLRDQANNWQLIELPPELAQNPVYDLIWSQDGLKIGSEMGLYRLNDDGKIRLQLLPDQSSAPVYQVLEDASGATWMSAYRKLFFQYQQQPWQTVTTTELGSSPWFSSIYQDKDQNIWLSSFSDGVFLTSRSQIRRIIPGADPIIRSVSLTSDGQLVFASQSDVGILSTTGDYQRLITDSELLGQTVHDLHWSESDTLWLGLERGLFEYVIDEARLRPLFPVLQGQAVRVVQAAYSGGVWVGAQQGLFLAQHGDLQAMSFNSELESRQITTLSQNKSVVVFGTSRGAYRWYEQRLNRLGVGSALYNAFIMASIVLPDNTILISTLDDGIFMQSPGKPWLQLHSANGLPHGPALSFHFHQQSGWLWISTHKGIFRLWHNSLPQPAEEGFRLEEILSPYDRQMGSLTSRCCNGAGQAKVAYWQEQFWYPTLRGLVAVPEQFVGSAPSGLQVLIKRVTSQHNYQVSGLQQRQVLEQHERNLSISFSALEYKRPDSVFFRYRLVGFDQGWHDVADRREAVYTNLPPGNFEFTVQARYAHQSWQDAAQAQLSLQIPRRFDETLLYRLLWLLLLLCSLYGVFWLYRQNNLMKQEQLANLVKQRTQELENTNQKLNQLNEQLSQLTHRDAITGLRNLRFMQEQLPKDIEHFQRNRHSLTQQGKTIALLLIEMEHYQQVLERFGRHTADTLLQQASALLIRETGGSDYVVRYADDCFAVVFRDISSTQVKQYSSRLLNQLAASELLLAEGQSITLVSLAAYALYPLPLLGGQLLNWEVSMQLAEQALHQLKTLKLSNKLATFTFEEQLDAFEFEESKDIELQISRLLNEGLITLHYS